MLFRSGTIYFLFLFMIIMFQSGQVIAQTVVTGLGDIDEEARVRYSILPLAGYSSDTGLFGGAFFQRLNYGDDRHDPFLSNTKTALFASLRGEIEGLVVHEHTRAFKRELRSLAELEIFRSTMSNFFGIGNNTQFEKNLYQEDFYFFKNRKASITWRIRKTLAEYGFNGNFDLFTDLKVTYVDAAQTSESSTFAEFAFEEKNLSGWTNMIGLGLIADDRDNEFNPTEGYRYEAGVSISHSALGGDFNFAFIWGELRNYAEIISGFVIAHKFRAEHITGNAPFWELSTLGNDISLRGYHLDRFRGQSSILNIFEARTWLFSIFDGEVRFGGQLFWDSGRVFSANDSPRIFNNWKHSYGAGGAISLFNPDFIVRGDVGISNETYRIYAGIGYIF